MTRYREARAISQCLIITVVIIGIGLAALPSSASAAAGYVTADEACQEYTEAADEFSVVLLLEDGTIVGPGASVVLYPETDARVVLCDRDTAESAVAGAWSLSKTEHLKFDDPDAVYYEVTTTDSGFAGNLASLVSENRRESTVGPNLSVITPAKVTLSYLQEPVTVEIQSEDTSMKDQVTAYNESLNEVEEAQIELKRATESDSPTRADITIEDVDASVTALNEDDRALSLSLFTAAQDGSDPAAEALVAHRKLHRDSVAETETAVENYAVAAETEARQARLTIVGLTTAPFVLLGLIGGVLGQTLARRRLESVRRERRRRKTVEYSLWDLKAFLFVGLFVLAAGLLLVLATGTTTPLMEVIL